MVLALNATLDGNATNLVASNFQNYSVNAGTCDRLNCDDNTGLYWCNVSFFNSILILSSFHPVAAWHG
jgi:hypothetical protein